MTQIILYSIQSEKYFQGVMRIVKKQINHTNIIYVTTNKPYAHLTTLFQKNKVPLRQCFFIDCISKHIGAIKKEDVPNCVFVEGPQSLTSISIAINEAVKHIPGEKIVLLDSLSLLLMYNDAKTIGKFANFFINKMRSVGVDTIIFALEHDIDKDVMKQLGAIVDKVSKG